VRVGWIVNKKKSVVLNTSRTKTHQSRHYARLSLRKESTVVLTVLVPYATHWYPVVIHPYNHSFVFLRPYPRVLEHLEPRPRSVRGEPDVIREPRHLPPQKRAFGVRHHGEVSAVCAAKRGDAEGRAVGVQRVLRL
jgi:hypothetical protein